jgi:hypothetical protein
MSIELVGLFTLLVGAWGACVPFVGPIFGYTADGTGSWDWTSAHAWLFLVPGAVAAVGGVFMMGGGATRHGAAVRLGGLLAMVAGAWFVIGPIAWPVLQGASFYSGYSTLHEFSYWIGYSLGPGVLLAWFGAYALGRPRPAQKLRSDPITATRSTAPPSPAPSSPAQPSPAPSTTAPSTTTDAPSV